MNLWLDDIRKPWEHGALGWRWAKTAEEAIALLKTGKIERASLDHDLREEHYPWNCTELPKPGEGTGLDVVLFLADNPHLLPKGGVRLHSANPAGVKRMADVLERIPR